MASIEQSSEAIIISIEQADSLLGVVIEPEQFVIPEGLTMMPAQRADLDRVDEKTIGDLLSVYHVAVAAKKQVGNKGKADRDRHLVEARTRLLDAVEREVEGKLDNPDALIEMMVQVSDIPYNDRDYSPA